MTGLRANEKGEGVGVLGIILLIVLVAIVVAAGFFTYKHFHKSSSGIVSDNVPTSAVNTGSKTTDASQTSSTASSQSDTSATTESATGTTAVKFTQLGVQMTVPNTINDLIYLSGTTKTTPVAKTAIISTTTLSKLDPACGIDATKTSATLEGIGELYEYPGTFTASTDPDKTSVWSKQFTSFYIAYNAPASNCSTTASTNTKAQSQITALKSAFSTMTVITP
jgi:hypothetical protein